ncbi:MAG: TraB/GumN family protein, partial [Desulfotignum sp.]
MEQTAAENQSLHRLSHGEKQILLIGTAHVSRQSAQLVTDTILAENPDTVCVELCHTRLAAIRDADRWRNMDIVKIIREKRALMLFMNLLLASFQKKIADRFDIRPGQEMINAVAAAEKVNAAVVPADRDIQVTLSRVWRGMGLWAKIKLFASMVFSFGASDDIQEADIEKMKQEDILETLLAEVKKSHPIIQQVLIDERDQYLATRIRDAAGTRIVAVVGAAHVPGIKRYLTGGSPKPLDQLDQIPPAGPAGRILKWLIPGLILVLFAAGFAMEGKDAGTDMIWIWVAANGIFAGLGAALALAHPYTIVSAVLAAP